MSKKRPTHNPDGTFAVGNKLGGVPHTKIDRQVERVAKEDRTLSICLIHKVRHMKMHDLRELVKSNQYTEGESKPVDELTCTAEQLMYATFMLKAAESGDLTSFNMFLQLTGITPKFLEKMYEPREDEGVSSYGDIPLSKKEKLEMLEKAKELIKDED